jgi:cyanate permease
MVVALAITETISFGILLYAFTVFIAPMEAELGWSRATLTGGFSLATLVNAVVGIGVGRWLDRRGARSLMTAGSIGAAMLVYGWSRVESVEVFYAVWVLLGVVKAMVLYEPAFWVVSAWFSRQRRQALTLMTFIAGFSSLIFAPLTQALINNLGWRATLAIYALLLALVTVPMHALLLRRRPADMGLAVDGDLQHDGEAAAVSIPAAAHSPRSTLRQASFWWLTGAFTLSAVSVSALLVHLVPYLSESGYSRDFAALVYGLIGAVSLPGRLILTPLGDRYSPTLITAGMFLTQGLGVLALLGARSSPFVWVFLLLFAAGYGAVTPARAALVAEFYGAAHYGTISGALTLAVILLSAASPVTVGWLRDMLGSYDLVFVGLTACTLLSVVMILLAARARSTAFAQDAGR